jgi:acetolactate synthase-1/2/3 large subunit
LGTRFDDRVTGKLDSFAPEAKVIHADIDPAEIGKNRNADVPIVGDVKAVIADLIEFLRRDGTAAATLNMDNWWEYLRSVQSTYPLSYGPQSDGSLSPEYVIETLGRIAGPDAVFAAGVGQHQMWAAQFIKYENPKTWLNSGGLGTMGFAIPAAMGAKFARPDAEVWAIDGDGCFQMTNQELATCAVEGAPIKVAVINNGNLGMVRQWQTLFYEKRYSQTNLGTHGGQRIPDFVKLAEALGCVGLRCERAEDVEDVINQARAINDRPVVIDFIVGADAQVWPMVAAGMGNDEIQAAKGIRPLFDDSENEGHA